MRSVVDVLVRVLVAGGLAWLVGWAVMAAGPQDGGANIGAGLAAFAVLVVVALVWSVVDGRRWGFVRTLLVWLVVGVIIGLLSAWQAQSFSMSPDATALRHDLLSTTPFMIGLVVVPAAIGGLIGSLLTSGRTNAPTSAAP